MSNYIGHEAALARCYLNDRYLKVGFKKELIQEQFSGADIRATFIYFGTLRTFEFLEKWNLRAIAIALRAKLIVPEVSWLQSNLECRILR